MFGLDSRWTGCLAAWNDLNWPPDRKVVGMHLLALRAYLQAVELFTDWFLQVAWLHFLNSKNEPGTGGWVPRLPCAVTLYLMARIQWPGTIFKVL